nr:hypothetical protein PIKIBBIB_00080 [Gallid alphaherpesvirus 2]WOL21463.1 hypothetical protein MOAAAGMB_00071 [Gallid alphaherpesvirus 2]WOL21656.1 hypothetical protein BMMJLCPH_00081 [Gallid alphaherpesvirus 2]WOL21772.1 hypothetical protein DMEEGDKK_00086 [Gallid alphaherpesvirus 2]WOL21886.1 hypothetical protein JGFBKGGF_00083 [Gallid alphaherpesvirus 2]
MLSFAPFSLVIPTIYEYDCTVYKERGYTWMWFDVPIT